jgi:hypothetical protein
MESKNKYVILKLNDGRITQYLQGFRITHRKKADIKCRATVEAQKFNLHELCLLNG